MIQSRAAIANGHGSFTIEDTILHTPQDDEVLVQIKAAGICHTDWDSLNWGKPIVMGHEGAGIVVQTGNAVQKIQSGDAVILNWAIPCGHCFQCLEGNQHICENNSPVTAGNKVSGGHAALERTIYNGTPIERSFSLGTMSEYTVVREAALVKIDHPIPFPSAAIISCGVMTGYGSAVNAAKIKAGSSVVVIGCGGVGLNVIQGARISGALSIIAVDINENRLSMSKKYGATHTVLASKEDTGLLLAAKTIKEMTQGRGADYAFECTAVPQLVAAPLAMVRNAGTAVQVSGCETNVTIDMNLFEWDKIYINPLYGKCRPQVDMPIIQQLYAKGDLLLDEMITRQYALDQLSEAFDDMHKGKNAKGVIVFN
ncbi:MAG TPA: Zn-dependent alcohol dehydrogenase [Agriterribacter sp.]|nr:Zn-dependent alcohol dehydrogenase [Agriterribacter sp.]